MKPLVVFVTVAAICLISGANAQETKKPLSGATWMFGWTPNASASYFTPTPELCKFAGANAVGLASPSPTPPPNLHPCKFPGDNVEGPTVLADFPDGVSSDGRGAYVKGEDGVIGSNTGHEGALTIFDKTGTARNIRSFSVNLNKPVPGGGGVPLGIVTSGNGSGFLAQRQMAGDTVPNLMDIPVGKTETAALMSIAFHINRRFHILQMGPVANGHCMEVKNLVHGTGTSSGTITRVSRTKWVIDLPAGSIGRLFDLQGAQPGPGPANYEHAVDKGLYYVHLHYEIGR